MIQPKYKEGDRVTRVRVTWSSKQVKCPDCLGTAEWKVVAPSGEEWQVQCNTCSKGYYSDGKVSEWGYYVHKAKYTIGSVRIDTGDKERPVSYMCIETGVGSGSIYDEKELFLTEEEADSYGLKELERVKGFRQAEELRQRKRKKKTTCLRRK